MKKIWMGVMMLLAACEPVSELTSEKGEIGFSTECWTDTMGEVYSNVSCRHADRITATSTLWADGISCNWNCAAFGERRLRYFIVFSRQGNTCYEEMIRSFVSCEEE